MGRFFNLVDTPEHKEEFKRHYRILSNVSIEHYNLGEWHEKRPFEAVVIPMSRVARNFLNLFRLCPT